jgi:hypothetical protein
MSQNMTPAIATAASLLDAYNQSVTGVSKVGYSASADGRMLYVGPSANTSDGSPPIALPLTLLHVGSQTTAWVYGDPAFGLPPF